MTADIDEKVLEKLRTFAALSDETLQAESAELLGRIHAEVIWKDRANYPSQLEALCRARVSIVELAETFGANPEIAMRSFERRIEWLRRPNRNAKWRGYVHP